MNRAIAKGSRTAKPVRLNRELREEISHWLFLESWNDPIPWRDDRHMRASIATDASGSGWGGTLLGEVTRPTSDYWSPEERSFDIATW